MIKFFAFLCITATIAACGSVTSTRGTDSGNYKITVARISGSLPVRYPYTHQASTTIVLGESESAIVPLWFADQGIDKTVETVCDNSVEDAITRIKLELKCLYNEIVEKGDCCFQVVTFRVKPHQPEDSNAIICEDPLVSVLTNQVE
jgi:hypothetical protein